MYDWRDGRHVTKMMEQGEGGQNLEVISLCLFNNESLGVWPAGCCFLALQGVVVLE